MSEPLPGGPDDPTTRPVAPPPPLTPPPRPASAMPPPAVGYPSPAEGYPPAGAGYPPVTQSPNGVPMFANGKPAVDEFGEPVSQYSRLAAALLCFFLGAFGIHRFYVGKIGTGIAIILTLGGFFGIWPLIDLIMILVGAFRDKAGRKVYNW